MGYWITRSWRSLVFLLVMVGLFGSLHILGKQQQKTLLPKPQRPSTAADVTRQAKKQQQNEPRPHPQPKPDRWAVVIGISQYQNLPKGQYLQFAADDAQAFYNFIRSPRGGGFPVSNTHLLLNEQAKSAAVRRYLGTWLPRSVKEGDIVYIYYAGHGMVEPFGREKRAYWVTYDADPQDLNTTAVPMDEVKAYVEKGLAKAGQVVLITDCCRAGYLGDYRPRGSADEALINKFLEEVGKARKGFLRLLASRDDESSQEDAKHGVFTRCLLQGLNGEADMNKDQFVRAGELITYLSKKVPEVTDDRQHPRYNESYDDRLPLAILSASGPPDEPSVRTPAQAPATLTIINGEPGTEIYFDGEYCGRILKSTTRKMKPVPPEEYDLILVTKEGEERTFKIRLAPGTNVFDAAKGKLVSDFAVRTRELAFSFGLGQTDQESGSLVSSRTDAVTLRNQEGSPGPRGEVITLHVVGQPETEVYIDDVFVGRIPSSGMLVVERVAVGRREITVVGDQGEERSTTIHLAKTTPTFFDTGSGRLVAASSYERQRMRRADFYAALAAGDLASAWDYYRGECERERGRCFITCIQWEYTGFLRANKNT